MTDSKQSLRKRLEQVGEPIIDHAEQREVDRGFYLSMLHKTGILDEIDALQAENERLRAYRDRLLEWHREAKPVVDAAMAWFNESWDSQGEAEDALIKATETYEKANENTDSSPADGAMDGLQGGAVERREGKDELLNAQSKITQRVAEPIPSATDAGESVPLLDTSPASYFTGGPPDWERVQIVDGVLRPVPWDGLQSAAPEPCEQPNDKLYQSADTTSGDDDWSAVFANDKPCREPAPSGEMQAWWDKHVAAPVPFEQPNVKLDQSADTNPAPSGDDAQTIHAVDDIHSPAPSGDDEFGSLFRAEGREQGIREAVAVARGVKHNWQSMEGCCEYHVGRVVELLRDLLEGDDG